MRQLDSTHDHASPSARSGMAHPQKFVSAYLLPFGCILSVTALIIIFNGGIGVGTSNHVGLVPVVRRILDPNYLPGDFSISLRFYHHRVFAYLVAAFVALLGEDRGLIVLHVVGMLALGASLFYLCRSCGLSTLGYLAVGSFLAVNAVWTGLGLEENNFVGNREIMPTTFAHAAILLGVGTLMRGRYQVTALLAGVATALHLQVGAIFVLLLAPFYLARWKEFGAKEIGRLALCYLLPMPIALWHISRMIERGATHSSFSLDYLNFRMPHHFELFSVGAALWIATHLLAQAAGYSWLRWKRRPESRAAGMLLLMSAVLVLLALVHFADYYVFHWMTILKVQFPRLSPLVSVFGALVLVVTLSTWAETQARERGRGWIVKLVPALLLVVAASHAVVRVVWDSYFGLRKEDSYLIGVKKYVEQPSTWADICRWINAHAPRDTVYLTPPGQTGFTYLTHRSNVAEFKLNPDGAQYLEQWYERLRDLCGGTLPHARGFPNRPLLNRAYASLKPEQLTALGEKYHARYAVLPQSSPAKFEVVYENQDYRLVKLPVPE